MIKSPFKAIVICVLLDKKISKNPAFPADMITQGGSVFILTTATPKDSKATRTINYATSFTIVLNTTFSTAFGDEGYENNFAISKQYNNRFDLSLIRITGTNNQLDQQTMINYVAWGIA